MNKQQQNTLVITGVATGSSSNKIQLKPKPVVQKPKYQPPPLKQAKKQTKQQPQKQQQKQQPPPETKVVHLTESILSDKSEPDQPQFVLKQESIQQKEVVQVHVPVLGDVVVRYSHYKEKFPIKDGQLLASDIDAQYCLSHVFKGDYKLILKTADKSKILENMRGGWVGCENGQTYWLEVDEDPIQEEWDRKNHKAYEAPKDNTCPMRNKKVELITEELKGMSIQEIQEKGGKFKELIEARDLEDILFK